ncbi:MAG: hypothetical protein QOJ26_1379, partial [Thermoplasmata archaeon]|nr:hypothetical protein [Thermoplasmata archaeon]
MRALAALALLLLLAGCTSPPAPVTDPAPTAGPAMQVIDPQAPRPAVQAPTFLPPVELGTLTLGAEPSVAIAPDGTVYVTTPLALWRSDDQGKTFKPMGEASCPAAQLPSCPGLEAYDPGLVGGGDG